MSTRRKLVFATVGVVLLLAGFLLGFRWYLISRVAKLRDELRAKGEKLTVEELRGGIRAPETNGALDLLAALSQLPYFPANDMIFETYLAMRTVSPGHAIIGWKQPDLRISSASRTNTWDQLEHQAVELRPVLEQISVALRKPTFDFQIDYSKLNAFGSMPLSQLRSGARLLASQTQVHLHAHKLDSALASIGDQLAAASALRGEPLLICQLVRFAFSSLAFASTWEALQADDWSDEQLLKLQEYWLRTEFLQSFQDAMLMERALTQSMIDQARHSTLNLNQYLATAGQGPADTAVAVTRETAKSFLHGTAHMVWCWFASYKDEYDLLQSCEALIQHEREASAARSYRIAHEGLFGPKNERNEVAGLGSVLAQIMLPSWSNCLSKPFLAETERDMAVAAIALKRYSLRHTKLPSQLSDLVPEFLASVPIDSMDGQPLRYRLNTNGTFLLYSVGKDGRDDGGDPKPLERNSKSFAAGRDLVWPLPADSDETDRYNEDVGNQIRKRFDQKASREQSAAKNRSNPPPE